MYIPAWLIIPIAICFIISLNESTRCHCDCSEKDDEDYVYDGYDDD